VSGDGSIGLNFAELNTAVRHGVPLVVVVNNDQGWGMSRHGQVAAFGEDRRVAVELGAVRYDLAAAGFGAQAELVRDGDEIRPALERAFASGVPSCINVITDPSVAAVHVVEPGQRKRHTYDPAVDENANEEVDLPYCGRRRTGS
jgi:acetolactate synthase-1/2/3 large subunit